MAQMAFKTQRFLVAVEIWQVALFYKSVRLMKTGSRSGWGYEDSGTGTVGIHLR